MSGRAQKIRGFTMDDDSIKQKENTERSSYAVLALEIDKHNLKQAKID